MRDSEQLNLTDRASILTEHAYHALTAIVRHLDLIAAVGASESVNVTQVNGVESRVEAYLVLVHTESVP